MASSAIWVQLARLKCCRRGSLLANAFTVVPVICCRSSRSKCTSDVTRGAKKQKPWSVNNTQPARSSFESCGVVCNAICLKDASDNLAHWDTLRWDSCGNSFWRNASKAWSVRLVHDATLKCWIWVRHLPSVPMVVSSSCEHPFRIKVVKCTQERATAWTPCPETLRHQAILSRSSKGSWATELISVVLVTVSRQDKSSAWSCVAEWRKQAMLWVDKLRQSRNCRLCILGQ